MTSDRQARRALSALQDGTQKQSQNNMTQSEEDKFTTRRDLGIEGLHDRLLLLCNQRRHHVVLPNLHVRVF